MLDMVENGEEIVLFGYDRYTVLRLSFGVARSALRDMEELLAQLTLS